MCVNAAGKRSLGDLTVKILPKDLDSVVGRTRIFIIDFFASINAFFKVMFLGPWKDFWKNVNIEKLELANTWKLACYKYISFENMKPHEKAFIKLTGYEVYVPEDAARLKRFNKDFKVYQIFEASVSEKDHKKLDALLNEVEKTNNSNYHAVLVSLQALVQDRNVSKEVKDLINEKLKGISEKTRRNIIYVPEKQNACPVWKKAAVGVFVLAGLIAAGVGGYRLYLNYVKTPDTMSSSPKNPASDPSANADPNALQLSLNISPNASSAQPQSIPESKAKPVNAQAALTKDKLSKTAQDPQSKNKPKRSKEDLSKSNNGKGAPPNSSAVSKMAGQN